LHNKLCKINLKTHTSNLKATSNAKNEVGRAPSGLLASQDADIQTGESKSQQNFRKL
jgi:hypothetical protein